jgi:hypothetical protein
MNKTQTEIDEAHENLMNYIKNSYSENEINQLIETENKIYSIIHNRWFKKVN